MVAYREPPSAPTLGSEIRRLRTALSLSTSELAARAGLREAFLISIENDTDQPSNRALERLATQLAPAGATLDMLSQHLRTPDLAALERNERVEYEAKVRRRLRANAAGFILFGLAHFYFDGFPERWGYVLITLGLTNYVVPFSGMFLLNALVLGILGLWTAMMPGQRIGIISSPFVGAIEIAWAGREFLRLLDVEHDAVEPGEEESDAPDVLVDQDKGAGTKGN